MIVRLAEGALILVAAYLALGVLFAAPFLIFGIGRIDPAARGAPWSFRALLLPGVAALWPFLFRSWLRSGSAR